MSSFQLCCALCEFFVSIEIILLGLFFSPPIYTLFGESAFMLSRSMPFTSIQVRKVIFDDQYVLDTPWCLEDQADFDLWGKEIH